LSLGNFVLLTYQEESLMSKFGKIKPDRRENKEYYSGVLEEETNTKINNIGMYAEKSKEEINK
jgi:hypothetical protein